MARSTSGEDFAADEPLAPEDDPAMLGGKDGDGVGLAGGASSVRPPHEARTSKRQAAGRATARTVFMRFSPLWRGLRALPRGGRELPASSFRGQSWFRPPRSR